MNTSTGSQRKARAVEFATGQRQQPQRQSEANRVGDARAVVQREQRLQRGGARRGQRIEQRRPLRGRCARELRRQPVAVASARRRRRRTWSRRPVSTDRARTSRAESMLRRADTSPACLNARYLPAATDRTRRSGWAVGSARGMGAAKSGFARPVQHTSGLSRARHSSRLDAATGRRANKKGSRSCLSCMRRKPAAYADLAALLAGGSGRSLRSASAAALGRRRRSRLPAVSA